MSINFTVGKWDLIIIKNYLNNVIYNEVNINGICFYDLYTKVNF